MQEVGAVIGGEGNGGVINPDLHYGRDALAGAAMFLQLLANRKISASDYRKSLPSRQIIKEKMSLDELGMDADDLLADRKSTRLNSSHVAISYAVFCLKKKKGHTPAQPIRSKRLPPAPGVSRREDDVGPHASRN